MHVERILGSHVGGGVRREEALAIDRAALQFVDPADHELVDPCTGVPRPSETAPPYDTTVGLCLGPCGGQGGGSVSHERGTPVLGFRAHEWKDMPSQKCFGWRVGVEGLESRGWRLEVGV